MYYNLQDLLAKRKPQKESGIFKNLTISWTQQQRAGKPLRHKKTP